VNKLPAKLQRNLTSHILDDDICECPYCNVKPCIDHCRLCGLVDCMGHYGEYTIVDCSKLEKPTKKK